MNNFEPVKHDYKPTKKHDESSNSKTRTLYLCSGLACGTDVPDTCFLKGGICAHTSKADYRASEFHSDFPYTEFEKINGALVEKIPHHEILKKLIG